ncbi:fluoride efflux transporter CrcB [Aequorivita sp. SDUM287046]|uniref:Fluoride-specific ion channel FluC n=1 Tax=Aequorivita aurantiaca TaxID=3053356 RepID=A0ABT8DN26_9FLAO|nr:fluoride efflux transporter CrcB [Aequorivita aurantiaca]MDN3724643.1 fluoride efflux transporter CrcB [Aequorivita aurantiaca]
MKQLALVFIGGGFGSVLRYLLSNWLNTSETSFPIGTFASNIIGCFLVGLILGAAAKNITFSPNAVLLLATGFCGGFTTFSTFALESNLFLKNGDFLIFALYTIASFAVGLAMVFLGLWLVK